MGDCSSWVFSYFKGDQLSLWQATGDNDMYQHADNEGIIIGGCPDAHGSSALTVMNNFSTGRSGRSDTYNNDVLCSTELLADYEDFEVVCLEIWGFEN